MGSPKSKVLLVGGGGVGTMAAYALETGGLAEVTTVLRSNYSTVLESGFSIDSIEHGRDIRNFRPTHILNAVPKVTAEALPPFDYIVVTTKNTPDIPPSVVDIIAPAVTPGRTAVLLLQNGLNIEKPIIQEFPDNIVLSGVSTISASEPTPGHIIHEFPDVCKIGAFDNPRILASTTSTVAQHFVKLYNACGKVNATYDKNVAYTRWRKLVYNSSFNSVSALLGGMGVTTMRRSQHVIDDLVLPIMHEIIATAAAAGISLPVGIDLEMIKMDPLEDDFVPSMGQDAAKGTFMEVETIVGEVVSEAEGLGVQVPVLRTVYGLLKGLQVKVKIKKGMPYLSVHETNPYL